MWLDLVKKSISMRKDTKWMDTARIVARVCSIIISLFVFTVGLVLGNFGVMAPGIALVISLLSISTFVIGNKLVLILVPDFGDPDAHENQNYPIAYAINMTKVRVSSFCFLTFLFLIGYTLTVKRLNLKNTSFIFTMCWVGITLPLVQISLLAYVRFGARKLLAVDKEEKSVKRGEATFSAETTNFKGGKRRSSVFGASIFDSTKIGMISSGMVLPSLTASLNLSMSSMASSSSSVVVEDDDEDDYKTRTIVSQVSRGISSQMSKLKSQVSSKKQSTSKVAPEQRG
jgi:hypothetical protein